MSSEQTTLAAVLITRNEESRLEECLASVSGWVDEIVILDSGSTDRTRDIAERFGARFFTNSQWPGFGRQRQLAQTHVTAAWCLWIDADERVTESLRGEILDAVRHPSGRRVYAMPRLNWFFGRYIRHCGWYPKPVVRLHPTALTGYDDAPLHEAVRVSGDMDVVRLKGDLLHFPYADLKQYVFKSTSYAHEWAMQSAAKGRRTSLLSAATRSFLRFMRMYFIQLGFLDGRQGFLLSVLSAYYTFLKYAGLWALQDPRTK